MTHVGIVISERKREEAQISNMFCDFWRRDYRVILYLLDEVNYDELRMIELFTIFFITFCATCSSHFFFVKTRGVMKDVMTLKLNVEAMRVTEKLPGEY